MRRWRRFAVQIGTFSAVEFSVLDGIITEVPLSLWKISPVLTPTFSSKHSTISKTLIRDNLVLQVFILQLLLF